MSSTTINAFHISCHLGPIHPWNNNTLESRYYFYAHFTNENTGTEELVDSLLVAQLEFKYKGQNSKSCTLNHDR